MCVCVCVCAGWSMLCGGWVLRCWVWVCAVECDAPGSLPDPPTPPTVEIAMHTLDHYQVGPVFQPPSWNAK